MDTVLTESGCAVLLLAAAKRKLGVLTSTELRDFAMTALENGTDSPSLRILAGERDPVMRDIEPVFVRVLAETHTDFDTRSEAGLFLTSYYCRSIVAGSISPWEAAERIWWDIANQFKKEALGDELSLFVGIAISYREYPNVWPLGLSLEGASEEEARAAIDDFAIMKSKEWLAEHGGARQPGQADSAPRHASLG